MDYKKIINGLKMVFTENGLQTDEITANETDIVANNEELLFVDIKDINNNIYRIEPDVAVDATVSEIKEDGTVEPFIEGTITTEDAEIVVVDGVVTEVKVIKVEETPVSGETQDVVVEEVPVSGETQMEDAKAVEGVVSNLKNLINEVKDLKSKFEQLSAKNEELETKNEELKNRLDVFSKAPSAEGIKIEKKFDSREDKLKFFGSK